MSVKQWLGRDGTSCVGESEVVWRREWIDGDLRGWGGGRYGEK